MSTERTLLALLLALPFFATLPMGSNYDWAMLAICLICFTAMALYLLAVIRHKISVDSKANCWLPGLLLLAAGYMLLQTLPLPTGWRLFPDGRAAISLDIFQTRLHALLTLAFACYAFLLLQLLNSQQRVKLFAYALVVTGLTQAAYGAFMTLSGVEYGFFQEKTFGRGVATGTYVNRNHLAGLLEMSLGITIGLLINAKSSSVRWNLRDLLRATADFLTGNKGPLRLAGIIMVIALVMTHSRMGNTAFFSTLLIIGLLYILVRRQFKPGTLILLGSILLLDILIVGNWFGIEKVVERLQVTPDRVEQGAEIRVDANVFNWHLAKDSWLTGTGAGTYDTAIPEYMASDIGIHKHAHNDYLQFLIEHGLLGSALFALIVGISLTKATRALINRTDTLMVSISCGTLMGILAIGIHSSVDFNLQIPANALIFLSLLVLAVIAQDFRQKKAI